MRAIVLMFFALWMLPPLAAKAAKLKNAGFETGDFSNWGTGGQDWRISTWKDDQRRGKYGAVTDVFTNDVTDEYRVVAQDIKASGGKPYTASAFIRAVCVESTESFLEVQFFDEHGNLLEQFQSERITRDQDFQKVAITNMLSPAGTSKASIKGVVRIKEMPKENTDFHVFDNFDFDLLPDSSLRRRPLPAAPSPR